MAITGLMIGEFGFWVMMAAWFGCMVVSAVWWDENRLLRFLPILFGVPAALLVSISLGRTDMASILGDVAIGIGLGAIFWFCVWLETRLLKT